MNIEIQTFKDWKKDNYTYDLMSDLEILKKVEFNTFNENTLKDVVSIRGRMMNSKRTLADKETIKKYCYINYYLMHFLKHTPNNFDRLLELVNKSEPIFVQDLQLLNK